MGKRQVGMKGQISGMNLFTSWYVAECKKAEFESSSKCINGNSQYIKQLDLGPSRSTENISTDLGSTQQSSSSDSN